MADYADYTEIECPKCGQQLRIPGHLGGMLMACPTCGQKFYSDFKLAGAEGRVQPQILTTVFKAPCKILARISRYFTLK